jgi:hypothetical protein
MEWVVRGCVNIGQLVRRSLVEKARARTLASLCGLVYNIQLVLCEQSPPEILTKPGVWQGHIYV